MWFSPQSNFWSALWINHLIRMRHWWLSSLSIYITITILKQEHAADDQAVLKPKSEHSAHQSTLDLEYKKQYLMRWESESVNYYYFSFYVSVWTYLYICNLCEQRVQLHQPFGNSLRLLSFCFPDIHFSYYLPLLQCSNSEILKCNWFWVIYTLCPSLSPHLAHICPPQNAPTRHTHT